MNSFISWHKKIIKWWGKKLNISDYGMLWVAFIKGIVIGLLIYYSFGDCVDDSVLPFKTLEGFSSCAFAQVMTYTAFVGSIMVSYLRSRAEGLGIECKVGIMTRPERVAVISIGLVIANWVPFVMIMVLIALTVLGLFTTVQRLIHSSKEL